MKTDHKILLVDDDVVSNYINLALLEDLHATSSKIEIATNGREALNFVIANCTDVCKDCPTIIFLDLKMPVMDGFEFLEEFNTYQNLTKKIQIYLLTSSSNPRDIEKAQKYNISGYLSKPLTSEQLKDVFKISNWHLD